MFFMWYMYVLLCFVSLLLSSHALESPVPQVPLCSFEGCPSVSRFGMGTLHLGNTLSGLQTVEEVHDWLLHAYSLGITLFDLADVYPVIGTPGDSVDLFGQALALTPGLRENLTLVCKTSIVFPSTIDTSVGHLSDQLIFFLTKLRTTYVDILMIHYSDSRMDSEATANLFKSFQDVGKVKYFGVSNHFPSKFDLLQQYLNDVGIRLVTHEFEASVWNPSYMNYNSELADHAQRKGIRVFAWCPTAGEPIGGLNRLFVRTGERQRKILQQLSIVGSSLGVEDNSVVALTWLLDHPSGFIPLLGTTNLTRMSQQITALNYVDQMSRDQWWDIAGSGGLCALGDSQCNYDEYRASPPSFPSGAPSYETSSSSSSNCGSDVEQVSTSWLGQTLIIFVGAQFVALLIMGVVFTKHIRSVSNHNSWSEEIEKRTTVTNPL